MKALIIPDTQVKPGHCIKHIIAAGNYLVKHRPDVVVVLGDFWDCESLSVFNTPRQAEGLRILDDLMAGREAMDQFLRPLHRLQRKQRANKKKVYKPKLVFITGNHDPGVRIERWLDSNPAFEGMIKDPVAHYLDAVGFEVVPFREMYNLNGIYISHYICNPHSLKGGPLSGAIDTMLKNAGHSFIMGHQQTYKMGKHYLSNGQQRLGIVAGAFYQHEEAYMGPQSNKHWRGIIHLNEVKDGSADVCEISIDYLMRKYGDKA